MVDRMGFRLNTDKLPPRSSYLSPPPKRSLTARTVGRMSFMSVGFSSPKCVRASHEMLIPAYKLEQHKHSHIDMSKSVILNNRRIGEKLLLDSFPLNAKKLI